LIFLSIIAIGIAIERFYVFKHIKLHAFPDKKAWNWSLLKKSTL